MTPGGQSGDQSDTALLGSIVPAGGSTATTEQQQPSSSPVSSEATRSQACERCWRRKQRCDRKLPKCTNCQRKGFECLARVTIPKESFDGAGLTHASFHSYIESLSRNVESQESPGSRYSERESLARPTASGGSLSISPGMTQGSTAGYGTIGDSTGNPQIVIDHIGGLSRDGSDEEDPSVGDTMDAIGSLTHSAMAESSRVDHDQATDKLSMLHMVYAALAIDGHDPSSSAACKPGTSPSDPGQHCALPQREDALEYLRCYLNSIYHIPCLAIEDESTIFGQLDGALAATRTQQQRPITSDTTTTHIYETYLKVAVGIMYSSDAVRLGNYAYDLHSAATKLLPAVMTLGRYTDSIRYLLLLTAFSMVHPRGGSLWHLLGSAIRMCITAGFHKEPGGQTSLSPAVSEDVRWLFWSIYVLDRWVGVAMNRPFGIQDKDVDIQIPMESQEGESNAEIFPQNTKQVCRALALHLIRHAHLLSNIRTSDRATLMSHYGNLSYWLDLGSSTRLPSELARSWRENTEQLACRALVQMVQIGAMKEPTQRSNTSPDLSNELCDDTLATCCRFIKASYNRIGEGKSAGSFLDAYDLIAAVVCYMCLRARRTAERFNDPGLQSNEQTELMETVYQATVLVTQISSRFPALDGFHQLFLTLSRKAAGDQSATLLGEYPHTLPWSLRCFIETNLSLRPAS